MSLLAFGLFASCGSPIPLCAQTMALSPSPLASAKTIYFIDQSGADAVGAKAVEELGKWGRFGIVSDRKHADLVVLLVRDPDQGGDLIFASGQTGTIDSSGHVQHDASPTFNKGASVSYAVLRVIDPHTGAQVWSASHRWGGLLTGFNSAGERLVKELEKATEQADDAAKLKVVKSMPARLTDQPQFGNASGSLLFQIVVDKNGNVTSAKAIAGPPELARAGEDAARQWQFAPPPHAPLITTLELTYGHAPTSCTSEKNGGKGSILFAHKLPIVSNHSGSLKILDILDDPMPPYPEAAREAGKEGNLKLFVTVGQAGEVLGVRVLESVDEAIDDAAVETLRKWKFKVSRGEDAGFPLTLSYRLDCDSTDANE